MEKRAEKELINLIKIATERELNPDDFAGICESVNVVKMYYDLAFDSEGYRGLENDTSRFRVFELYSNGKESNLKKKYTYYYNGSEYVHAIIEFEKGIDEEDIDKVTCQILADNIYLLVSRQNMRIMLDFLENNDVLTGIPNLKALTKKYMKCTCKNHDADYVVVYGNVKNFKYVNDRGGVHLGDYAMAALAQKLTKYVKEDEGVCRVGGDNFAFFVKRDNLDVLLVKLKSVKVEGLMGMRNGCHKFSFYVGVSDTDVKEFATRIEEASTACIVGKTILKKDLVIFNAELSELISHNNLIVAAFPDALSSGEFEPFFQPKVNMKTGELIGMEALCRWVHNDSAIAADEFIPLLDRKGMIHELDMQILHKTCEYINKWKDLGRKIPTVSVNFSKKNIFVPDIEKLIVSTIKKQGIDLSMIEIEITETAKESEIDRLIEFVHNLKMQGLRISIDDFGTGYSSLSLIHNIDADEVKIDKSFVQKLGADEKANILIESIISIAERLGMQVIAEGVETVEEGKKLLEMGCVNAQGFFYGHPLSHKDMSRLLAAPSFEIIDAE